MSRTLLEKYEQILAADPRSRIFVELAKGLVDGGSHERAIEVCRQGLEHHPGSILGRVVWGRALLERGDTAGAIEQFGHATGLDPNGPYAFNLVGEVLLAKGLLAEALPVLTRAAQLQPADARIRGWLDDTRRRLRDVNGANGAVAAPAAGRPAVVASANGAIHAERIPTAASPEAAERSAGPGPTGEPALAERGTAPADLAQPGEAAAVLERAPQVADAPGEPSTAPEPLLDEAAGEGPAPETDLRLAAVDAQLEELLEPAAADGGLAPEPLLDQPRSPLTSAPALLADAELPPVLERVAAPAPLLEEQPAAGTPPVTSEPAPLAGAELPPVLARTQEAAPQPPELPRLTPPPIPTAGAGAPGSLLSLIPGDSSPPRNGVGRNVAEIPGAAAPTAAAHPTPSKDEAARIAAEFEQEMRARLLAAPEPPPSLLRRHRRAVLAAAAALALVGAAAVYLVVDARNAAKVAVGAAGKARAGLARDTAGSLAEAARLLAEARRRDAAQPELASLAAAVAAVRATEHGDAEARELARSLVEAGHAGEGALAARWLLAATPAERAAVEAELLKAPPSSEPLLQALAGRILLGRGEREGGRGRLELAARATPPLLRALSDLGDAALADDDPEGALALHAAALAAHPTHPRAAVGLAEARLALGQDLDVSRRELAAVEADAGSAPPLDLRERFALATARVLAATGDPTGAADRLAGATRELGDSPALAAAAAEVQLAARAWDQAEAAARRAVTLAPKDVPARVLLARALIGRGRFAAALAATDGLEGRALRIQRAIARHRLGQQASARAELEHTARDGRLPAEAAVWYALTEIASGRPARARAILEKLLATRSPPALTHLALGRALEAERKPEEAEGAYRTATERDPAAPEPHLALGGLLLARGRVDDALPFLERAVALDPADPEARRTLGAARLAAGKPAAARVELDAVLLARPADPDALQLLSAAWLAEDQPAEARLTARRGLAAAPRHPALLLAGARAALAVGERTEARALAARALKLSPRGEIGAEARKLLASVAKR